MSITCVVFGVLHDYVIHTSVCVIQVYLHMHDNYILIITSVLRLLHRICVHCYTYHTTFMHFRYLLLDIFILINIIYLKHIIIRNSMTLSSTPPLPTLPPFPTSPLFYFTFNCLLTLFFHSIIY